MKNGNFTDNIATICINGKIAQICSQIINGELYSAIMENQNILLQSNFITVLDLLYMYNDTHNAIVSNNIYDALRYSLHNKNRELVLKIISIVINRIKSTDEVRSKGNWCLEKYDKFITPQKVPDPELIDRIDTELNIYNVDELRSAMSDFLHRLQVYAQSVCVSYGNAADMDNRRINCLREIILQMNQNDI